MNKLAKIYQLALAKLHTHKACSLAVVMFISGLFGILIISSMVANGLLNNIESLHKNSLNDQHIVSVIKAPSDTFEMQRIMRDPALIADAKQRYQSLVERKISEAKKLGIEYNQASDQPPYTQSSDGIETLLINDQNHITQQILNEKYADELLIDEEELTELAKRYNAAKIYSEELYKIKNNSALISMPNGHENFYSAADIDNINQEHAGQPINGDDLIIAPPEITSQLTLPSSANWQPDSKSLPIILPQNSIEQLLNLEPLPTSASTQQISERLNIIRQNLANIQFSMCYRNDISLAQIKQAITQQKEITANQNNPNYQKPSLLYSLPNDTSCQNAVIASDTRTAAQKLADNNQKQFNQMFGKDTEPISQLIHFKVVGISPSSSDAYNFAKNQLYNDIINQTLQTTRVRGQIIPSELYNQLPNKNEYASIFTEKSINPILSNDNKRYYLTFSSANDANNFINQQGCTTKNNGSCEPAGNPYQINIISTDSALARLKSMAEQWFVYIILGAVILATVITWAAFRRIIINSRPETATLQVIGFRRAEIGLVYVLYALILIIIVAFCANLIGLIGANIISAQFAKSLAIQLQYNLGLINFTETMNLIGVNKIQLIIIFITCVASIFMGFIVPLIYNLRRKPSEDL